MEEAAKSGGSPVGAKKAEGLGLIDAVIDGDLRAGALAFASDVAEKPLPQPRKQASKLVLYGGDVKIVKLHHQGNTEDIQA